MANMKFNVEEEIYFWDIPHTNDEEVCYDVVCFDGCAIGMKNEMNDNPNTPNVIFITYPKMEEVIANGMADECTLYRYCEYYHGDNLCYGDIMMCYGEVRAKC